ncbi:MAG TPA: ECF-type sigma factor [Planctomycetaceae bacterium]|nr:ECF-type sigma factor [Planctomycetaceae bacterium]
MSADQSDPVRTALDRMEQGDATAADALWNAYFQRLAGAADRHIGPGLRRTLDGEDVAVSIMQTIYRRASNQQLVDVADSDELWKLMLTILYHKVADKGRAHRALKRGGGQVRGHSIFIGAGSEAERQAFAFVATQVPTPDMLVQLEEERQRLFDQLGDDDLRQIAQRRLEGATAEEIALEVNLSPRTIRRKLDTIREQWSHIEE